MICCLPVSPGERLGQPDRLDDLAGLALIGRALERLGREELGADELLGDRRSAARLAGERVETGRHDADRVEARVGPEVLVLDRGRGVEHLAGQLVERDQLALEVAEARQLDLAGPVVDDRLLLELDVGELLDGVGQAGRVVVVGADGHQRAGPGDEAGGQDEGRSRTTRRIVPAVEPRRPFGRCPSARRRRWRLASVVCMGGRTIA